MLSPGRSGSVERGAEAPGSPPSRPGAGDENDPERHPSASLRRRVGEAAVRRVERARYRSWPFRAGCQVGPPAPPPPSSPPSPLLSPRLRRLSRTGRVVGAALRPVPRKWLLRGFSGPPPSCCGAPAPLLSPPPPAWRRTWAAALVRWPGARPRPGAAARWRRGGPAGGREGCAGAAKPCRPFSAWGGGGTEGVPAVWRGPLPCGGGH